MRMELYAHTNHTYHVEDLMNDRIKQLVKNLLDEERKVPVTQEVRKWERHDYVVTHKGPKHIMLTKGKNVVTIHHDGEHVTHNEVTTVARQTPETKRDVGEAEQQLKAHKMTVAKRRKLH